MFEQTFVQTGKTNKAWTVFLSFGIQLILIGVGVILPLIFFDVLPAAQLSSMLTVPPPPPPPPPPPAAAPPKVVKVIPRQFDGSKLVVPKIPKEIKNIQEDEAPPAASAGVVGGVPGGATGGAPGGVLGGILGAVNTTNAPPPPKEEKKAPPPPPKQTGPVAVGGRVQAAKLIVHPDPIYPQIAKTARIAGKVILQATIGENGHIEELHVISGHAMLQQAALAAVKQWVYQPTTLNEQAVKVSTTIEVNFTLSQ